MQGSAWHYPDCGNDFIRAACHIRVEDLNIYIALNVILTWLRYNNKEIYYLKKKSHDHESDCTWYDASRSSTIRIMGKDIWAKICDSYPEFAIFIRTLRWPLRGISGVLSWFPCPLLSPPDELIKIVTVHHINILHWLGCRFSLWLTEWGGVTELLRVDDSIDNWNRNVFLGQ